jgi:sulfur relay (sulfurtransferase) complex TusBCD TusD component (DsrE family)
MADAVFCAKSGQKVPEGYYNTQLMLGQVARKGEVGLCGTCMDALGQGQCGNAQRRRAFAARQIDRLDRDHG